jgi:hypothetical protein
MMCSELTRTFTFGVGRGGIVSIECEQLRGLSGYSYIALLFLKFHPSKFVAVFRDFF